MITIGDTTSQPVGVGTVKIQIRDNESNLVDVELERVLSFPHSPVNVISVTYLAHQFSDEESTWIKTKMQASTFTWDHEKHSVDFYHPTSKLPILTVSPTQSESSVFCSLFESTGSFEQPVAMMTCQTCLPCDSHDDICFLTNIPEETNNGEKYRYSKEQTLPSVLGVGNIVRLSKNGTNAKVKIESIRLDNATQIPYFTVEMPDSHHTEITQEFLFPLDEEDLVRIPVTKEQVQDQIQNLTTESFEALLNPPEQSELMKEFMVWHVRLGYLNFPTMFKQCRLGLLPRRFLELEKKRILCPHCSFGKAKRRAWRNKSSHGHLRSEKDIIPGDATSMDHVISA